MQLFPCDGQAGFHLSLRTTDESGQNVERWGLEKKQQLKNDRG